LGGDQQRTNGFGKVILDMDELRQDDIILQPNRRASGIHQISKNLCGNIQKLRRNDLWQTRPLAVYHYLGNLKRYLGKGDVRRKKEHHDSKSNLASVTKDGPWLDGWLKKFVEVHGLKRSQRLLPNYLADESNDPDRKMPHIHAG
jgi:hypothetical protein